MSINSIFELFYSYIYTTQIKNKDNMENIDNIENMEYGEDNMNLRNNSIQTHSIQNKHSMIKLFGIINETFQHNFLKQYSTFKKNDSIYIEITSNGGDFHIAYMISQVIQKHDGLITIVVPFHLLSYGTMIALSADKIILSHIGCLGTIPEHIKIQNELMYIDDEIYNASIAYCETHEKRRTICCGIRDYISSFGVLKIYIQRLIQKIRSDKRDLIDNILDKYSNPQLIKKHFIVNSHYSNPLYINDLKDTGLDISVDNTLISKFSSPIKPKKSDELCKNMNVILDRISKKSNNITEKRPEPSIKTSTNSNSNSNSISNLISLITKKIDVDTK